MGWMGRMLAVEMVGGMPNRRNGGRVETEEERNLDRGRSAHRSTM